MTIRWENIEVGDLLVTQWGPWVVKKRAYGYLDAFVGDQKVETCRGEHGPLLVQKDNGIVMVMKSLFIDELNDGNWFIQK